MNYKIVIENNFDNLLEEIRSLKTEISQRKVCIVTDSNVSRLYLNEIQQVFEGNCRGCVSHVFPAGEANKHLGTITEILQTLTENHFDRKDLVVALGGGVTGDIAGFAASIYMRGIEFVQIPTSLLAQVDSSIGGKTGVDFNGLKNLVGAFYEPGLVYINLQVINTLPDREFKCGLGEILKHSLLHSEDYYYWLKNNREAILKKDPNVLAEMIERSGKIKQYIVENDWRENGIRALLNFGHTLGHAIEKEADFKLSHGACIAIGMNAACWLSALKGRISEVDYHETVDFIRSFGLPTSVEGLDREGVYMASCQDKKNQHGHFRFILLNSIGDAYIDSSVTESDVRNAIDVVCK